MRGRASGEALMRLDVICTNFALPRPTAYVTGYYLAVHTALRYLHNAG